MTKLLRFFRPSHQHTAFSATLLLMGTVMLSRVIGYVREAYIAYAFGAGRRGVDHVHLDLHAISGGETGRRGAEDLLYCYYGDDGGSDGGHDCHRDFHAAVCALDVSGILAGAVGTLRSLDAHSVAGADFLLRGRSGVGGVAFAPAVSFSGVWAAAVQHLHHSGGRGWGASLRHRVAGLRCAGGKFRRTFSGKRDRRGEDRDGLSAVV